MAAARGVFRAIKRREVESISDHGQAICGYDDPDEGFIGTGLEKRVEDLGMPRYVIKLEASQETIDALHAATRAWDERVRAAMMRPRPLREATETSDKKIVAVDASGWTLGTDLYDAILPLLGAPDGYGHSQDALVEFMVYDKIGAVEAVEPPYILRIRGTAGLPTDIAEQLRGFKEHVDEARDYCHAVFEQCIDVDVELLT